ncbi:hypothetical protein FRC12_000343 [Ceratobasidium sp. 428]|nr:hypothetical protein FRC12_000343 [Ceratobasidium sp. 428]
MLAVSRLSLFDSRTAATTMRRYGAEAVAADAHSDSVSRAPQQYNFDAGFQSGYAAGSPTSTFPPQNNGPGANSAAALQQQSFPNFNPNGTPNQATSEINATPGPGSQRNFTPQRGVSDPNPNSSPGSTPQRDFPGTPASGCGFLGTPTRDLANDHVIAGTPSPRPHAFLPPNQSLAGTPHADANSTLHMGALVVGPGTAMRNHGLSDLVPTRSEDECRGEIGSCRRQDGYGYGMSINGINTNLMGVDGVGTNAGNEKGARRTCLEAETSICQAQETSARPSQWVSRLTSATFMNRIGMNGVGMGMGMDMNRVGRLGNVNPGPGGVNSALGVNPAMTRANSALATGMNLALSGAMNPALPGSIPFRSSQSVLSPTKASERLPIPLSVDSQIILVTALPLLKDESGVTHDRCLK